MRYELTRIASRWPLCCTTPIPPACLAGTSDRAKNDALVKKGCCARCPDGPRCNGCQPCPIIKNKDTQMKTETKKETQLQDPHLLEVCAMEIERGAKKTLEGVAWAGKALAEARKIFGENDKAFGQWREKRLPWLKQDTARNWINVWTEFGENLLRNGSGVEISQKALYLLSAPSIPEEAKAEAREEISKGNGLSVPKAKQIKEKHAPERERPAPPPPPPTPPPASVEQPKKVWRHPWDKDEPVKPPFKAIYDFSELREGVSQDGFEDNELGRARKNLKEDVVAALNKFHPIAAKAGWDNFTILRELVAMSEDLLLIESKRKTT